MDFSKLNERKGIGKREIKTPSLKAKEWKSVHPLKERNKSGCPMIY